MYVLFLVPKTALKTASAYCGKSRTPAKQKRARSICTLNLISFRAYSPLCHCDHRQKLILELLRLCLAARNCALMNIANQDVIKLFYSNQTFIRPFGVKLSECMVIFSWSFLYTLRFIAHARLTLITHRPFGIKESSLHTISIQCENCFVYLFSPKKDLILTIIDLNLLFYFYLYKRETIRLYVLIFVWVLFIVIQFNTHQKVQYRVDPKEWHSHF